MNATERQESAKQIREQLRELKRTLDATLPMIRNDVQDLEESEALIKIATGESREQSYITEIPQGFIPPSNIKVHEDINLPLEQVTKTLESLLENWITYGNTIESELNRHESAIQQNIERRLKGD